MIIWPKDENMNEFEEVRYEKRRARIPPLIVCPHCQPGTISYAGKVIPVVCKECREALARAAQ